LALDAQACLGQLDGECLLVGALEQSRAENAMDLDGAADDAFGQAIGFVHLASLVLRA
jgi:hypothetical protein